MVCTRKKELVDAYSEDERAMLAKESHALPDGSYPMPDCAAVQRAVDAYGRAPDSHRKALASLIYRRNEDLGCGHDLQKLAVDAGKEPAHTEEEASHA